MLKGASITRFEPWMDVIGPLHELENRDGYLVAEIGRLEVSLPQEMHEKLKGLIGHRIGILRADNSDYRLKILDGAHG